jgi:nitroreductase
MELESVIQKRRSIRKFLARDVENEKMEKILECARLCQSAKNRQPWRFMVLKGEQKDHVAQIMLNLFEQNDIDIPNYVNSSKNSARVIKEAPVFILVFRQDDDDHWMTGDLISIGAAVEHICLEAVNLGLGALWIRDTVYTQKEICRSVGCESMQLVCSIAIGYPAESPNPRPRKPMNEILLKAK